MNKLQHSPNAFSEYWLWRDQAQNEISVGVKIEE